MESLNNLVIENSDKKSSSHSRTKPIFSSSSSCSFEEDNIDRRICDLEFSETGRTKLPEGFENLISKPLIKNAEEGQMASPNEARITPLFHRALSVQATPTNSRVCTRLFEGDAKTRSSKKHTFTTGEPERDIKRSKLVHYEVSEETFISRPVSHLQQDSTQNEKTMMCAVQISSSEQDMVGDFSRNCSLPLIQGRHRDLKAISPQTMAQLIKGSFRDVIGSFKIIDCRYPYEFESGHITGAVNLYTREQCMQLLNNSQITIAHSGKRDILLFHCEFSSERGPNLYRFLRKEDRNRNKDNYPSLNFPEVYLLEGGYKSFFEQYSEMCTPMAYKQMLHPDHTDDLRHFKQKSKTWNCDSRGSRSSRRPLKKSLW
ncbi:M-phase inducer phosphatase-like [Leptinotarsa decemlineata]|uniref:M-phase inducer phosphatase-like n=1 Tax=Leptinotarsa decemlineata TaxID=7539 RepID=UPI003D3093C3